MADCVEKLCFSALALNLAEQSSDLLKFQQHHWAMSEFQGTIFYFSAICRCGNEFFNTIGRNLLRKSLTTPFLSFAAL
ncbi:hypothetical protein [Celeribacter sp.]|uniref:hypothetical protein n=1 Tax=Celeribacter sp. TaxID=1890673 RepID=UPI003A925981